MGVAGVGGRLNAECRVAGVWHQFNRHAFTSVGAHPFASHVFGCSLSSLVSRNGSVEIVLAILRYRSFTGLSMWML
jgi:hypothetical protein